MLVVNYVDASKMGIVFNRYFDFSYADRCKPLVFRKRLVAAIAYRII